MSTLLWPHRAHRPTDYAPFSFPTLSPSVSSTAPWNSGSVSYRGTNPYGLSQPSLSLFNDTFSQLDRLSSDLNSHLNDAIGTNNNDSGWSKVFSLAPKFDVKETDSAYILEGELPGVAKKDIKLNFMDDNTLALITHSETFREEGSKDVQNQDTTKNGLTTSGEGQPTSQVDQTSTAATTNNQNTEVAKTSETSAPKYHLTERSVGTFQRAFYLPGELLHEEVKANLKNGVLTVMVPKVATEPAKEEEEDQKNRSVTIEEEVANDSPSAKS